MAPVGIIILTSVIWVPSTKGLRGLLKICRDIVFHDFLSSESVPQTYENFSPLRDDIILLD